MARGLPAVWSTAFALPFLIVGTYLFGLQSRYPLFGSQPRAPPVAGLLLVGFGLFVFGLGVYVHFVAAPDAPRMREGESVIDQRDPAQRNALTEAGLSLPVLGLGGYLLYFTARPLVYPTVVVAVGLFLFSRGVHRYWRNTLTTYFLTTQRVLEEYRFISLVRNEVPHEKVRAVEERRSAWDSLFGLGDVRVRSGASGELTVSIDDVYDSTAFADRVRTELRSVAERGATTESSSSAESRGDGQDSSASADGANESTDDVSDPDAPAGDL